MSKPTIEQLSEMHEQIKAGRITRKNLQAFLRNPNGVLGNCGIITIDRSRPFNPVEFLGEGLAIWKGPVNGDGLSGEEDQDERSLALTEVNLADVKLVTMLNDGEDCVKGEEQLKRLKASGQIRLDAKFFQTLWENQHLVPESWKEHAVCCDGTLLRSTYGSCDTLRFYWNYGRWCRDCCWLKLGRTVRYPSAVLQSSSAL